MLPLTQPFGNCHTTDRNLVLLSKRIVRHKMWWNSLRIYHKSVPRASRLCPWKRQRVLARELSRQHGEWCSAAPARGSSPPRAPPSATPPHLASWQRRWGRHHRTGRWWKGWEVHSRLHRSYAQQTHPGVHRNHQQTHPGTPHPVCRHSQWSCLRRGKRSIQPGRERGTSIHQIHKPRNVEHSEI